MYSCQKIGLNFYKQCYRNRQCYLQQFDVSSPRGQQVLCPVTCDIAEKKKEKVVVINENTCVDCSEYQNWCSDQEIICPIVWTLT